MLRVANQYQSLLGREAAPLGTVIQKGESTVAGELATPFMASAGPTLFLLLPWSGGVEAAAGNGVLVVVVVTEEAGGGWGGDVLDESCSMASVSEASRSS